MRDRWLSLSPAGWHNLVTGLLRERQYEMALEKLEAMEIQGITVRHWLYALVVYNLADAGEFSEVLHLMETRVPTGVRFSTNLWFLMLDKASNAMHKDLTTYIWKQQVLRGYLIPSYGVCSNVLAICARTGDTELAVSVFDVLEQRKTTYTLNDYESLLETYVTAGDIETALRVLCTMEQTNVGVQDASTRGLLSALILSETAPQDIWQMLKRLHTEEKRTVPVAAANLVIELCGHRGGVEEALKIYREVHTTCSSTATATTFNYLFGLCRKDGRADMASFFLEEMRVLKILPTQETYKSVILFCVDMKLFEEARQYLVEMTESGFRLEGTAKEYIREKCAESDDKHAAYLQYDAAVRKPISRWKKLSPKSGQQEKDGEKEQVNSSTPEMVLGEEHTEIPAEGDRQINAVA